MVFNTFEQTASLHRPTSSYSWIMHNNKRKTGRVPKRKRNARKSIKKIKRREKRISEKKSEDHSGLINK